MKIDANALALDYMETELWQKSLVYREDVMHALFLFSRYMKQTVCLMSSGNSTLAIIEYVPA